MNSFIVAPTFQMARTLANELGIPQPWNFVTEPYKLKGFRGGSIYLHELADTMQVYPELMVQARINDMKIYRCTESGFTMDGRE